MYAILPMTTGGSINFSGANHVADPDCPLKGANLVCFSVCHFHFFVGGCKVYSQTGLEIMARFLSPPYIHHCPLLTAKQIYIIISRMFPHGLNIERSIGFGERVC